MMKVSLTASDLDEINRIFNKREISANVYLRSISLPVENHLQFYIMHQLALIYNEYLLPYNDLGAFITPAPEEIEKLYIKKGFMSVFTILDLTNLGVVEGRLFKYDLSYDYVFYLIVHKVNGEFLWYAV